MKIKKCISATEMLEILNKQWLNTKDIESLANVGHSKAIKIRNEIEKNLKEENYLLVNNFLPNEKVVEYLGININYLKRIERG